MKIEEKVDLMNEAHHIINNNHLIDIDININKSSTAQLKGWLFEYYSKTNNLEAYHNINYRTLEYKAKINKGVLEEGYIMCKQILTLQEEVWHEWNHNVGLW